MFFSFDIIVLTHWLRELGGSCPEPIEMREFSIQQVKPHCTLSQGSTWLNASSCWLIFVCVFTSFCLWPLITSWSLLPSASTSCRTLSSFSFSFSFSLYTCLWQSFSGSPEGRLQGTMQNTVRTNYIYCTCKKLLKII